MDGTLIDSEPYWLIGMDRMFAKYGVQLEPSEFQKTTGLRLDQVIEFWFSQKPFSGVTPEALAEEIYAEVLKLVTDQSGLMPGAEELLSELSSRGIPLALASSSNYFLINGLLKHFDIAKYFDIIQSAEEFQYGKPHPEVFLATAKKLDVQDSFKCLVVEDSLNGLLAAKSARMRCVLMPIPEHRERMQFSLADKLIGSLADLRGEWWQPLLMD